MSEEKSEVRQDPVGTFTFQAQLPSGKTLSFSGYVQYGDTLETIDMKMDIAAAAIERQRQIAEIPELEKKMETVLDSKSQVEWILSSLASKEKLTQQDKQQKHNMLVNLEKLEKDIEKGLVAIAAAKAKVKPSAVPA